jgi:hypothetical protein
VTQQRGQCTYDLVATTYKSLTKPAESDLLEYCILGRRIASGYDRTTALAVQPWLDDVWRFFNSGANYLVGMSYHLVSHRDMANFKDKFDKVGKLIIRDSFKADGSYGYNSTFESIAETFSCLESRKSIWDEVEFPISLICVVPSEQNPAN